MNYSKLYSYFLVISQFILIFLILLESNFRKLNIIEVIIILFGLTLGIWAVFVMKKGKLSVLPDVSLNATLVAKGPYKYIRHPMYAAVLVICFALLINNLSIYSSICYCLLLLILSLKITYEEKLLDKSLKDYKNYKKAVKRLIPFVF